MAGEATTLTSVDIAHAAAPEKTVVVHTDKQAEGRATAIREAVAKRKVASPAEGLKAQLDADRAFDKGEMQSSIDVNFGERDASGELVVRKNSPTEARKSSALTARDLAVDIVSGQTTEFTSLSFEQQSSLLSVLNSSMYGDMDPSIKQAILSGALKDPEFAVALKQVWGEAAVQKLEDQVTPAAQRLQEAEEVLVLRTRNRDIARARLDGALAAESAFSNGNEAAAIASLKTKNPELLLRQKNTSLQSLQMLYQEAYKGALKGNAQGRADMVRYEAEINQAQAEVVGLEQEAAKLKALNAGKEAAPGQAQALEDRLQAAEEQVLLASSQRNSADVALSFARDARVEAETKYTALLQKMPAEALSRYLVQRMTKAGEASAEAMNKLVEQAKTADEKKLAELMRSRYFKSKNPRIRRWDKGMVEENKGNIREDMRKLANPTSDGASGLIKDVLTAEVSRGKMTPEQMNSILANKELMKIYGGKYAEQVISGYIRTGGKISPKTNAYIESQEWGQDWIQKGVLDKDSVKQTEKDLKAKGILGSDGLLSYIRNNKKKALAGGLLTVLAGIAAGVITGPAGGAAAAAAMG